MVGSVYWWLILRNTQSRKRAFWLFDIFYWNMHIVSNIIYHCIYHYKITLAILKNKEIVIELRFYYKLLHSKEKNNYLSTTSWRKMKHPILFYCNLKKKELLISKTNKSHFRMFRKYHFICGRHWSMLFFRSFHHARQDFQR